jgi:GNAT superfamily N-acetyltransferase
LGGYSLRDYYKLTGGDEFVEIKGGYASLYFDKNYIGGFQADNERTGKELLKICMEKMKEKGCKKIIAPIDGSTWFSYRFVSWSSGEKPFLLEPQNPLWYNQVVLEAGFKPIQQYRSDQFSVNNIKAYESNVVIRKLNKQKIDEEFKILYELSINGFQDNSFYSDITLEIFKAIYAKMIPIIEEDLVVIAEVNGLPVGFIFAFDGGDKKLILKSMAVLNDYRRMRIGADLIHYVLWSGAKKGFHTAIAALMRDDNHSRKIVEKYGSEKIREYTVYVWEG